MKATERDILDFAATALGVPTERLSLETTFGSLPEWDSLAHVRLVADAESRFGVAIPFDEYVSVTSLWELQRRVNGGAVKKVLALDLDGVLWDGVIGEDGAEAVRPRMDFQRRAKELKERGILLVALSKNNPDDVRELPGELAWSDFADRAVDWTAKPDNLLSLAGRLNLSPDAFVFVDDNPAERAEMSARLPSVTVLSPAANLAAYFPPRALTAEDLRKTEMYQAEAQRRDLALKLPRAAWLADLCIEADVHPLRADEVARVAQLSQKANQFNFTAAHRSQAEVESWLSAPESVALTVTSGDRFGSMGLVGFVRATVAGESAHVEDFVLSCRAMGRDIELLLKKALEEELQRRGVTRIVADFVPSGRNEPARGLY